MELNEELYTRGKESKGICTIVDDDYVLISKKMPVVDSELESYLEKMQNAKRDGVNLSCVIDYRLIPLEKADYGNGVCFTKGVFLEERAQGISLGAGNTYLNSKSDYDYINEANEYFSKALEYIEEIERRSAAPQEFFDKLYSDFLTIAKHGLSIDPKPLNFFFDSDLGYTIIDVIPGNSKIEDVIKFYPTYFIHAIYSYGLPRLYVDSNDVTPLTQEMYRRLLNAVNLINAKVVLTLRKFKLSEEEIKRHLAEQRHRTTVDTSVVEYPDMENYLATKFREARIKMEEMKKQQEEDNFGYSVSGW